MTLPKFTAESALSTTPRCYRVARLPRGERITAGVQVALINRGGGGSNFWCSDDGTCTCNGLLDCQDLQPYCTDDFKCSNYPYVQCTCHVSLVRPPGSIVPRPIGGGFTVR
jgi:hypothetical protein